MNINEYVIYFICLSFIGYIYETIAMTIWSGKFDNRGFLLGPVIPIYGAGAALGTLLFTKLWTNASALQIFLTGVIASAIIEYPTHYILEKLFNQKWWDYSLAPLNINGRICVPAAIGFGIGGLLIIKVINPLIIPLITKIPNTVSNILSLIFVCLLTADFSYTISIISDFEDRVANIGEKIDDSLENLLSHVLNEEKPFKDAAYKVLYAPRNIKGKIKEVPNIAKQKAESVSKVATKLRQSRKEQYKKVVIRYNKYREYRRNAYAPKAYNEQNNNK